MSIYGPKAGPQPRPRATPRPAAVAPSEAGVARVKTIIIVVALLGLAAVASIAFQAERAKQDEMRLHIEHAEIILRDAERAAETTRLQSADVVPRRLELPPIEPVAPLQSADVIHTR